MNGILRSWRCLNGRCARGFDAWESNPACPNCGCVRVEWQPAGGHVGGSAKGADKELRALADIFKLGDLNSAQEGRAAKKVSLPSPTGNEAPAMNFGGGFAARIDPAKAASSENPSGAQCVPTANQINFRAKAGIGQAIRVSATNPRIMSNTSVEASYRPPR